MYFRSTKYLSGLLDKENTDLNRKLTVEILKSLPFPPLEMQGNTIAIYLFNQLIKGLLQVSPMKLVSI